MASEQAEIESALRTTRAAVAALKAVKAVRDREFSDAARSLTAVEKETEKARLSYVSSVHELHELHRRSHVAEQLRLAWAERLQVATSRGHEMQAMLRTSCDMLESINAVLSSTALSMPPKQAW